MSTNKGIPLRPLLMRLHSVLAGFFLPFALLFLITGVLYTLGLEGGAKTTKLPVPLSSTTGTSLTEAKSVVAKALQGAHLILPTGSAALRDGKKGWQFSWSSPIADANLQPTEDPTVGEVTYRQSSPLRYAMALHKAKGGPIFRALSVAWGTGLLLLIISGTMLAVQVKALKTMTLIAIAAGVICFFVAGAMG